MSRHNRRDPKLPDLIAVELIDKKATWQEIMARAKAKLVKPANSPVVSFAEKSHPEKE